MVPMLFSFIVGIKLTHPLSGEHLGVESKSRSGGAGWPISDSTPLTRSGIQVELQAHLGSVNRPLDAQRDTTSLFDVWFVYREESHQGTMHKWRHLSGAEAAGRSRRVSP